MQDFKPSLHGMRGVAALAVLLFHWTDFFPTLNTRLSAVEFMGTQWNLLMQLGFGWLGVYLFFVLSGYLLCAQLLAREIRPDVVGFFWLRRVLRIYPGVWFQLAVFCVLSWLGLSLMPAFTAEQLFMNALLWINLPPGMYKPINGVYWTLPIELSFYLVLPLVVLALRRFGWVRCLVAAFVISLCWRVGTMHVFRGDHMVSHLPILDALPGSLTSFMAGASIAAIQWRPDGRTRRVALLITAGVFVALQYWLRANVDTYWTGHWMLAIWNPLMVLTIAVGVFLLLEPPPGWGWLESRPLVLLGDLSYGIYLWHLPAMWAVRKVGGGRLDTAFGSAIALLAVLLLTIGIAAIAYRWIERPMMQVGRRASSHLAGRGAPSNRVGPP